MSFSSSELDSRQPSSSPSSPLSSLTGSENFSIASDRTYYNYTDVFLSEKYLKLKLLKPLTEEERKAYYQIQTVSKFFQEGCLVRSIVMGSGGGVLGLVFGTFFFTMRPVDIDTTLPLLQQVRQSYRGFGTEVLKSVKGFAKIGFLYSICDCGIARYRAKQDIYTAFYAGCTTGALLASWRGGLTGMAFGGLGFGVFSAAMELWNPLATKN